MSLSTDRSILGTAVGFSPERNMYGLPVCVFQYPLLMFSTVKYLRRPFCPCLYVIHKNFLCSGALDFRYFAILCFRSPSPPPVTSGIVAIPWFLFRNNGGQTKKKTVLTIRVITIFIICEIIIISHG